MGQTPFVSDNKFFSAIPANIAPKVADSTKLPIPTKTNIIINPKRKSGDVF